MLMVQALCTAEKSARRVRSGSSPSHVAASLNVSGGYSSWGTRQADNGLEYRQRWKAGAERLNFLSLDYPHSGADLVQNSLLEGPPPTRAQWTRGAFYVRTSNIIDRPPFFHPPRHERRHTGQAQASGEA